MSTSAEDRSRVTKIPDAIGGQCLAVRTRMLNRTITAIYDDALRPLGVTIGQLNVLVVVARHSPISLSEVAQRLNMEKSTVSRNVDRMRNNGWLNVTPAGSGRKQALSVTDEGESLIEQAAPAWEQAQAQARAVLGQGGAEAVHAIGNELLRCTDPNEARQHEGDRQ